MQRKSDTLVEIIDQYTGEPVHFNKVTTLPNGDAITDSDCDGVIYRKYGSEYFKRNYSGKINVQWFGAKGDGITNDLVALQSATSFAATLSESTVATIWLPDGVYLIDDTWSIPANISLVCDGKVLYGGINDRAAIILGEEGTDSTSLTHVINVENENLSDWSDEKCVGIIINQSRYGHIKLRSTDFTIGVQCAGIGGGFVYNDVRIVQLRNCKVGLDLVSGNPGYVNENNFFGGSWGHPSSANNGKSRYGVRIRSTGAGAYDNNNNNNFYKPSFELRDDRATPNEAIPVVIAAGSQNAFYNVRNETNSSVLIRTDGLSDSNLMELGYGVVGVVEDLGSYPTTILRNRRQANIKGNYTLVFDSGDLANKIIPYDATKYYIESPLNLFTSNSGLIPVSAGNYAVASGYVSFAGSRGIGVRINTSANKRFLIKRDALSTNGGRIVVRCFDSLGNILSAAGTVKGNEYAGLSYDVNLYGGAFQTGSDSNIAIYFVVSSDTAYADVMITGGTSTVSLKSFQIQCIDGQTSIIVVNPLKGLHATQAPASGTYTVGKKIYNVAPTASGSIGWVCVTAGTPGTWKTFGSISA